MGALMDYLQQGIETAKEKKVVPEQKEAKPAKKGALLSYVDQIVQSSKKQEEEMKKAVDSVITKPSYIEKMGGISTQLAALTSGTRGVGSFFGMNGFKESQQNAEDAKIDTELLLNPPKKTTDDVGNKVVKFFKTRSDELVTKPQPVPVLSKYLNFANEEMGKSDIFFKRIGEGTFAQELGLSSEKNDTPINIGGVYIRPGRLGNLLMGYNAGKVGIGKKALDVGAKLMSSVTLGSGKGDKEIADRFLYDAGRSLATKELTLENLKLAIKEGIAGRTKYLEEKAMAQEDKGEQPSFVEKFQSGLPKIEQSEADKKVQAKLEKGFKKASPPIKEIGQSLLAPVINRVFDYTASMLTAPRISMEMQAENRKFISDFAEANGLPNNKYSYFDYKKDLEEISDSFIVEGIDAIEQIQGQIFEQMETDMQKTIYKYTSGGLSLLELFAIAGITGKTDIGAGVAAYVEASDEYNNSRNAGNSPEKSLETLMLSGAGTYILEKFGADVLLSKVIKKIPGIVANYVLGYFAEGSTEGAQTIWQNYIAKRSYDPDRGLMEGVFDAITIGGFWGGPVRVATSWDAGNIDAGKDYAKSLLVKDGMSEAEAEFLVDDITKYVEVKKQQLGEVKIGSIKEGRLLGLEGVPGGLPQTSLATPSAKQFNTYKEKSTIEFEGFDDMKLIQDRTTGDVIGVQNRQGEKEMFPRPVGLEPKPQRGKKAAEAELTRIMEDTAKKEAVIEQMKEKVSGFSKEETKFLNKISERLQGKTIQEGDLETARAMIGLDLEIAIEKMREVVDPSMGDEEAFTMLREETFPSLRKIKSLKKEVEAVRKEYGQPEPTKRMTRIKEKKVELTEKDYIKRITKAQERASKAGEAFGKKTVREMHKDLTALVKEVIPPKDQGSLLSRITSVSTTKGLERVNDAIMEKAAAVKEKLIAAEKTKLIFKIKKQLKVLKTGKGKKGKTTVMYEMLRDGYNQILNNTQGENEALMIELEKKMGLEKDGGPIDIRDKVTYALLSENTKGFREMTNEELDDVITRLKQTRKIARNSFLWKEIEKAAELAEDVETAVELIDVTDEREAKNRRNILQKLGDAYVSLDITDRGFKQIFNLMDKTTHTRFFRDKIFQPVTDAHKDYLPEHFHYVNQDNDMFGDVFGIEDTKGVKAIVQGNLLDRKIKSLTKDKNLGVMYDADGESANLTFTDAEMMDIYIGSKMEDNRKALTENGIYIGQKGQKKEVFKFTDPNFAQIAKAMSKEAKEVADYIVDQVNDGEFMKEVTKAYENKYNKPFPFVEGGYWVLSRHHIKSSKGKVKDAIDMLSPDYSSSTIMSPSAIKERTNSDAPVDVRDAFNKYTRWREDMLRFVHYDAVFNDMLPLITNKDFVSAFSKTYGQRAYSHFYNSFFQTAKGGTIFTDRLAKVGNLMRSVLAIQHLGGRSRALVTQGGSALAAASEMPLKDFAKGFLNTTTHPKKAWDKMMESPLVRYRHKQANFNKGLFEAQLTGYRKQGLKAVDAFMAPIKGGDMLGVVGAGYTVYQYNYNQLKEKMSEVEADKIAMNRAESFIVDTQQSSLPEHANQIMQMHPVVKLAGAYQQPTSMYRAKGYEAIVEYMNSKKTLADKKKLVRQVTTYHVTLPIVFELSKGNLNPYSILNKTILSPFTGFMGYGKVIDYVITTGVTMSLAALLGADDDDLKKMEPFGPFSTFGEDVQKYYDNTRKALGNVIKNEVEDGDLFDIAKGFGFLFKIPVKNLNEEIEKVKDTIEGKDLLRLLETSWQYEQRAGKKSKSSKWK